MDEKNKLTNSARYKKNGGITLIALIITIIVMLILAAISINIALNGGLFEYAGKAGKETRLAALEEQLYTAYMSQIMADYANGTNNASLASAIANVNANNEYVIQPITAEGATDITLNPATTNIVIGIDDATKIYSFTVTPSGEGETNYYVVEGEKYYKINYNENGEVKIDRNPSEVNSNSNTLSIEIEDETIATASITGNTVTITGTKTEGNTTFKVKCGNVEKSGTITAAQLKTITFNANGGTFGSNNETTTVRGTAGSSANLPTAPTKENAGFTGWYTAASEGTLVYNGTESSITIPQTSTVVYAHWISMPEYTEMGTATAGNYSTLTAYWEYLYSDANNIYLIHKDYLPNQYAYAPTGITKDSSGGYYIYGNTSLGSTNEEGRSAFVNYLTTASNWQNISKAIARDLNTITGTSNYSTANVITKGAPTLQQVQTVLNLTTHKVGYVESGTTTVYSDESKETTIGTMSSNASATGWVYCKDWSSSSSTFATYLDGYFSTSQGTKLYTSDIANKKDKAYGYWLARSFCA